MRGSLFFLISENKRFDWIVRIWSSCSPYLGFSRICMCNDKYVSKYHVGSDKGNNHSNGGLYSPGRIDQAPIRRVSFPGMAQNPNFEMSMSIFLPTQKIVQHIWGQSLMRIRDNYHDYPIIIKLKSNLWCIRVYRLIVEELYKSIETMPCQRWGRLTHLFL